MYLASLDNKTAFDEAKTKHVAKISDGHNIHGWLILSGKVTMRGKLLLASTDACNGPEDAVVSEVIKQLLQEKSSSRRAFRNAS